MLSGDEFAAVLKSRDRRRSAHFSLHWLHRSGSVGQLGMVVPKRLARTSVRRNLIKRQTRELVRAWLGDGTCDRPDVVLKLTAPVAGLDRRAQFAELEALLEALPRSGTAQVTQC